MGVGGDGGDGGDRGFHVEEKEGEDCTQHHYTNEPNTIISITQLRSGEWGVVRDKRNVRALRAAMTLPTIGRLFDNSDTLLQHHHRIIQRKNLRILGRIL